MSQQVAVIGAGMMGRGIAACCASVGHDVVLYDNNVSGLAAAVKAAEECCSFLLSNGVPKNSPGQGRITCADTIQGAVSNASIVFEAVIEDTGIKRKVFEECEKYAPKTAAFCSNTSSLSVSEITQSLATRERCA